MKFGIDLPNFGVLGEPLLLAQLAQDAENAGWDGFFLWDHIARPTSHDVVDPWIALAAVATYTKRIRFGTMVTPLPRRRPWKVAREATSLDHLSGGRFVLGVGIGGSSGATVEWENLGEETDLKVRGGMLDEGLEIINGLWTGEEVNFKGKYYTVKATTFTPKPVQHPRIPIWVGGFWPHRVPFRRAARWDGMCPRLPFNDQLAGMKEVIDYTMAYRNTDRPFDIVYSPPPPILSRNMLSKLVPQFAQIGVTWWIDKIDPPYFGTSWESEWNFQAMHDHIKQGPPR
jgi:alkanesulfonate monooxygenase SsuD/methylene tetrahydromethanopterin reductase-like flavin-dependent oxidoreductase (luciferase family)